MSQTCEIFFFFKEWAILQTDPMLANQDFLLSWGPNEFYKARNIYKFRMQAIPSAGSYRRQWFWKHLFIYLCLAEGIIPKQHGKTYFFL